jgi:hypothetical protein
MRFRPFVRSLRRPEYTGENRCVPCTVVNLVLVAGAALAAAVALAPVAALPVAGFGVALVVLRGYVVPGTPTLTKRYLPGHVHAWFGHHDDPAAPPAGVVADDAFDPERTLRAAGALKPCADGEDLCLDPLFDGRWRSEMRGVDDLDAAFDSLLPAGVDGPTAVTRHGDVVTGRVADTPVAEWPSRAAFVADAAAAAVLADVDPGWDGRPFDEQTRLLAGLRLWLDACSLCGERVVLGEDTVESFSQEQPMYATSCTGCGARIFEAPK